MKYSDDYLPMDNMNAVTLAIVYIAAKKKEKILPLTEQELHPFVKDILRALAGAPTKTKRGKEAKAVAKNLIFVNFESVYCPTCKGERVLGSIGNWKKCHRCKGKGRVKK